MFVCFLTQQTTIAINYMLLVVQGQSHTNLGGQVGGCDLKYMYSSEEPIAKGHSEGVAEGEDT